MHSLPQHGTVLALGHFPLWTRMLQGPSHREQPLCTQFFHLHEEQGLCIHPIPQLLPVSKPWAGQGWSGLSGSQVRCTFLPSPWLSPQGMVFWLTAVSEAQPSLKSFRAWKILVKLFLIQLSGVGITVQWP